MMPRFKIQSAEFKKPHDSWLEINAKSLVSAKRRATEVYYVRDGFVIRIYDKDAGRVVAEKYGADVWSEVIIAAYCDDGVFGFGRSKEEALNDAARWMTSPSLRLKINKLEAAVCTAELAIKPSGGHGLTSDGRLGTLQQHRDSLKTVDLFQ
jgi:hypothetical protein